MGPQVLTDGSGTTTTPPIHPPNIHSAGEMQLTMTGATGEIRGIARVGYRGEILWQKRF